MRTDILEFHEFYQSPLGRMAERFIGERLQEAWPSMARLTLAGFGYATPYLKFFDDADARLALAPGGQGVMRWPRSGANAAGLVCEDHWPLPDASVDRLIVVHGLEEAAAPRRLMREIWRVLTDDGRVIIVAAHRRGLWSTVDATPFAAGRPYLKRRLNALLQDAMFRANAWSAALYFPPVQSQFLLRAARAWERTGTRAWPGLGGVIMVEAQKELMAPAGLVRQRARGVIRPIAAPHGAINVPQRAPRVLRTRKWGEQDFQESKTP
ncbi:MAG: methyltransferase domain-containing protein [Pseudomonadota bacterium]